MLKRFLALALMTATLSGCYVQPAPYYGGYAPYYGTTVAPAYLGVGIGGGYYPYYGYQHIHGGYNNGYWHAQNGGSHWGGHGGGRVAAGARGGNGHH